MRVLGGKKRYTKLILLFIEYHDGMKDGVEGWTCIFFLLIFLYLLFSILE